KRRPKQKSLKARGKSRTNEMYLLQPPQQRISAFSKRRPKTQWRLKKTWKNRLVIKEELCKRFAISFDYAVARFFSPP
ncbi:hypothetical protein CEXT_186271, partial [Caerostris extrusa]